MMKFNAGPSNISTPIYFIKGKKSVKGTMTKEMR